MATVIQDVGERPLILHSDARKPLDRMSFLQRALVLAELAMISYNDEAGARRVDRGQGEVDEGDIVIRHTETEPTS